MSSVGSSDETRARAEEQRKAESDVTRRHKKELRRMTEAHYREIEKIKQEHQAQLNELKHASSDAISSRDHRYQKDVQDLREMHRKQQKQTADDNLRREDALRKSSSSQLEQTKAQSESRLGKLSSDYENSLIKQQMTAEEAYKKARESQEQAISTNKERLGKAHEAELKSVIQDRNERVSHLQQNLNDFREDTAMANKEREYSHARQMDKASKNLMHSVANERENRVVAEEIMRDGYNDSVQNMRERFEKANRKEREASKLSSGDFRAEVHERIDKQVDRLESQAQELKAQNARKDLQVKASKDREIDNIRDAWGKNIENYKEQKDQILAMANEGRAKDVAQVREKKDKEIVDTNRFYRQRMEEQGRIQRMAYENLVGDFESRVDHVKNTTDQRVKTIYDNSAEEKERLTSFQKNTHIASQRQHQDEIRALRELMESDKQQAVLRLQDQIRKQEVTHADRMNQVVQKYEKQLLSMKDQMLLDRKNHEETLKRTVDEMARANKVALDQADLKTRERLRHMNDKQAEELRQVNKRHEDRLDQVMVEMKKT